MLKRQKTMTTKTKEKSEMVDFKKLMNRTPEEKALDDEAIEKSRLEFLELTKNDPSVRRMKRLLGEEDEPRS